MAINKVNTNKITLFLLIIAVLTGLGVFIYQSRKVNSLQMALEESEIQRLHVDLGPLEDKVKSGKGALAVVKKGEQAIRYELEELKINLSKAQELLARANEQNSVLQQENGRMGNQLIELREEIRLWEGQINNLCEKSKVLEKRARSVKELAKRVRDFKRKAQKELDAIKMELGNQGYLTKLGKTTFNRKNIVELEKIIVTRSSAK